MKNYARGKDLLVGAWLQLALGVFAAFCLASLCGCQPSRTEVIHDGPVTKSETTSVGGTSRGTVDSGGGNGLDGRMLDSYQVNVRDSVLFNSRVLPLLLRLSENSPRLASDFAHIVVDRVWYFVPGDLDVLPAEIIGAHLTTEQYALQNRQEVWVDERRYDALKSDDERATIMLHEIVMGVRLMAFQNSYDECLSRIALIALEAKDFDDYRKARSQCSQRGSPIPGGGPSLERAFGLDRSDYAAVRELTMKVWRSKGQLDEAELNAWMADRHFRNYPAAR